MKLENITKTFELKAAKVVALDNVSLNLPNKRLVFIVGKSGCGKTTLLNIIGGLDKPTSGNVYFNNQNLASYRSTEYDNYRNNYVGFIFQDYNLINNLTVYDNLNLVLSLQNNNNHQKINDVLSCVGLDNYEKRYPHQLSGGEMQRIAIARALVKDPAFILADEPTGNLDSVNSKEIFDILKVISKEKLVIVVTHDRESALKYHDRIIELSDGSIIYDSNPLYISDDINVNNKDKQLNNKVSLKLSFANLKIRKLKTIMAILLLVISITLTMCAVIYGRYTSTKGIYLNITKNNDQYLVISDYKNNNLSKKFAEDVIKNTSYNIQRTSGTSKDFLIGNYFVEHINNIQELNDFGLELYDGYIYPKDNGLYVPDFFVEELSNNVAFININNYDERLNLTVHSFSEIIEKQIKVIKDNQEKYLTINGIYKTPLYQSDDKKVYQFLKKTAYKIYVDSTSIFNEELSIYDISLSAKYITFIKNDQNLEVPISKVINKTDLSEYQIINGQGLMTSIELNNNNVVVSLGLYNKIFKTNYKINEIEKISLSDQNRFTLEIYDFLTRSNVIRKKYQIIGVALTNDVYIFSNYENHQQIAAVVRDIYQDLIIYLDGNYDKISQIIEYVYKSGYKMDFKYSDVFYQAEPNIIKNQKLFRILSILMLIVSIIFLYYYLVDILKKDKFKIAILKAMGYSNKRVYQVYLVEQIFIGICSFVLGFILLFAIYPFLNGEFDKAGIIFFRFERINVIILLLLSIILPLILTLIMVHRIVKIDPIKLLKSI